MSSKKLFFQEIEELFKVLKMWFEKNMDCYKGIEWVKVQVKFEVNLKKFWLLDEMESMDGELDVVGYDKKIDEYIFYDCFFESLKGRRSLCYDWEVLNV